MDNLGRNGMTVMIISENPTSSREKNWSPYDSAMNKKRNRGSPLNDKKLVITHISKLAGSLKA